MPDNMEANLITNGDQFERCNIPPILTLKHQETHFEKNDPVIWGLNAYYNVESLPIVYTFLRESN